MKHFLPLLFALMTTPLWSQTGNGVVLLTDASHTFTPTTVDSTTSFSFQLVNVVGVAQTVFFGALDAPFSMDDNSPVVIPSQDTIDVTIYFTPSGVGNFEDTLSFLGGVFGSAELILYGEGIQVQLTWSADSLNFPTTPIGQTSSLTLDITSSGNGAGTITATEFSNPIFSLDESSATTIDEGTTGTLTFNFSPVGAGVFDEEVNLYTNDPNNPIITIHLLAAGISEVSGEVCNVTWGLADSPFTLVDDIHVPEGCTLTIEPGTVVEGNHFEIMVEGSLVANGEESSTIQFNDCFLQADSASISIGHTQFLGETRMDMIQTYPLDLGYDTSPLDVFHEDFESYGNGTNGLFNCDNTYSGSDYNSSNTSPYDNGCYEMYVHSNASRAHSGSKAFRFYSFNYDANIFFEPQIVAPEAGDYYLSFGYKVDIQERNTSLLAYYRVNYGSWTNFYESPVGDYEGYGETSSQLDNVVGTILTLNESDIVEVYFRHRMYSNTTSNCYDEQISYIDDIRLTSFTDYDAVASSLYSTEGNWSYPDEFNEDGWTLDYDNNYAASVSGNSEYVRLYTQGYEAGGYDEWLQSPAFVASNSGLLKFDWSEYIESIYYYWRPRVQASINGGSYFDIYVRDLSYCESYIYDYYSGWYDRTSNVGGVNAGDTIRIRLNPFQNQGNSWGCYIRFKNLELYTIPVGATVTPTPSNAGDISLHQCAISPLEGLSMDGNSTLTISANETDQESDPIQIQNCALNNLVMPTELPTKSVSISGSDIAGELVMSNAWLTDPPSMISFMMSSIREIKSEGAVSISGEDSEVGSLDLDALFGGSLSLNHVDVNGEPTHDSDNSGKAAIDANAGPGLSMHLNYCRITGSASHGIRTDFTLQDSYPVSIQNCVISNNAQDGIQLLGNTPDIQYCTIVGNGDNGVDVSGSFTYLNQGTVSNNLFAWNENSFITGDVFNQYNINTLYPQFADDEYHLTNMSPGVDAAMPWHLDAHMPFGMGGARADCGAYGGPNNAGWGGQLAPSGSASISGITDSPQDQGNVVGIAFDASAFDDISIPQNVSHYAFWRHYDPTGQSISTVDEGNWELLGTMPAQSFSGYAYQAPTLGNTNDTGPFSSCYTVVAHTDDEDTYWYSDVLCGESVDNLAPNAPDLNGMVLEEGGAQISWADPSIEDYGYTRIVSDSGFEAEISADTLVVDANALPGATVTYTATHFDVNGNESDPSDITLIIGEAFDVIPLQAGWNLISLDREPADASISEVFADLIPGNLHYVTGFDAGVTFHDPDGLPFLNTLNALTPGYGYWVKVSSEDTLRAPGTPLGGGFLPPLDAGWNLIAYTAEGPLAPGAFFADLVDDGALEYVTGFDGGVKVYDPNGLPFLNTLSELRNGFGYWVKTASDFSGMAEDEGKTQPNPNYIVLNGVSNLTGHAGETVQVVTSSGRVLAEMPILEGGHLMTTAVYGAGPDGLDGIDMGEALFLEFAGERIGATNWSGDMAHIKLDVAFDGPEFSIFPNPATDRVDIRWEQTVNGDTRIEVLDVTGRIALTKALGRTLPGANQDAVNVSQLAPGAYQVRLMVDGRTFHQTALQRAE